VVLGPLLKGTGSRGPAEVPAKREYMMRDVMRLADSLGVPVEPPATEERLPES
jgi:2-hydroxychromene-2-carboxylate isomerase